MLSFGKKSSSFSSEELQINTKNYYRFVKFVSFVLVTIFISACSNLNPGTPALPPSTQENSIDIASNPILLTETTPPVESTSPVENQPDQIISTPTLITSNPIPNYVDQLPDPAGYQWVQIVGGLHQPVVLTHANDNSNRIFIAEQPGVIRILLGGNLLPAPFMDIQDRVGSSSSEQGLLGLAFHPDYVRNGYFFVNYTNLEGDTIIARFQRSRADENTGDLSSEEILMKISQPFANHNGGQVAFGPDGYLYIGTGDGGSGGDPLGNGQSLNTLLGKILRINVDQVNPYAIPADNPFISGAGLPEIWAYGLRNPWRFSFDSLTGDLYIADVGQNQWEEVNYSQKGGENGGNYGWNYLEGNHIYSTQPPDTIDVIPPAAEYSHDMGCSVTGGLVYRGKRLPEFNGVYLYGDFCSGNVWGLLRDGMDRWENELLFNNIARISSFGVDETGEHYLVDYTGSILLLEKR